MRHDPSFLRRADATGMPLLIARLLLGATFLYLGYHKVLDPIHFLKQVRLFHMLPDTPGIYLNAAAIVLPWLEIAAGTALILGIFVRGASLLIAIMLSVFTPALFLRAMGIHASEGTPFFQIAFDCGCGTGDVIIWKKLLTNLGLLIVALMALFSRSRRFCLARAV